MSKLTFMNPILVQTTLATAAAYIGGILAVSASGIMTRHLRAAVFAAMAVLFAVTLFDILPDAYHALTVPLFLVGVCSGFVLFWFLSARIAPVCPACAVDQEGLALSAPLYLILVLVALHSTTDGLALAVSRDLNGRIDFMALTAICVHKIPEGIALALLMISAGFSRRVALLTVFAIEFTTEIGGIAGLYLLHNGSPTVLGLIFANVGGGFLYLIGSVFLSHLSRHEAQARPQEPVVVSHPGDGAN